METQAVADALAPEPIAPSLDDELGAIYDKMDAPDETPEEAQEEPVAAPEPAAEAEEQEAEEKPEEAIPEAPSHLPREVRAAWGEMSEAAREAVSNSQRELSIKLAEQGKVMQGIKPIQDVLVESIKQHPQLADMKPHEVAREVMQLAKVSADFQQNPVGTLMGWIKQHKLEGAMQQALAGQPVQDNSSALHREIAALKRQLAQVGDPEYIRSQFEAFNTQHSTQTEVEKFAANAEHWATVENIMPDAIQFVRAQRPEGSTADILKAAYDLAVSQVVPQATKVPDVPAQATDIVAPEKAEAALKAKSVNVSGKPSKPRVMSEIEELSAAYDRAQKR